MTAGFGNSFHDFFCNVRFEVAGGQVIHEEERRSALHGNVIHAVVHQVAAHGVVQLHHEGHFEFCANPVHAGNQHRLAELLFINCKQAAEAADLAYNSAGEGAVGQILDALLGPVGAVYVNAAIGVSDWGIFQNLSSIWCELGKEIAIEGRAILTVILL